MIIWPFSAYAKTSASAYGSEAEWLQEELNNLVPAFSMDAGSLDTVSVLEKAIDKGAIQGLKSWSYEGVQDGDLQRLLREAAASGKEQIVILVSGNLSSGFNWNQGLAFLNGLAFGNSTMKNYSYSPPNKNKNTLTVRFNG